MRDTIKSYALGDAYRPRKYGDTWWTDNVADVRMLLDPQTPHQSQASGALAVFNVAHLSVSHGDGGRVIGVMMVARIYVGNRLATPLSRRSSVSQSPRCPPVSPLPNPTAQLPTQMPNCRKSIAS